MVSSFWLICVGLISSFMQNEPWKSYFSLSKGMDFPHTNSPQINHVWHNRAILRCFIFSRELSLSDILGCTYFFQVCFQPECKFLVISSVFFFPEFIPVLDTEWVFHKFILVRMNHFCHLKHVLYSSLKPNLLI